MKNQLQELEETIRLRRLYLQGQDNQIKRNQERVLNQKSQISQNEAVLKAQKSKLKSLTADSVKALKQLQKQAEEEPTKRVIHLKKEIENLTGELFTLSLSKTEIATYIKGAGGTLERLDQEIITADAIHKDLLNNLQRTQRKLKQAQYDAEFQVAVVSDLQNDVINLQRGYRSLEAARIVSVQERTRLNKLSKNQQTKLDTINNEIIEREKRLKTLQTMVNAATKDLSKISDSDKTIREGLADKKLKLQDEEANLKAQKAEMREELLARQQLNPKLKLSKPDNSKGYLKI